MRWENPPNMSNRFRIGTLITFLVAAVIALLLWRPWQQHPQSLQQASFRLKWTYSAGFGGAIVAADKGFFMQHGIVMKIEPGGGSLDPVQLVASGSNDFGITGADRLLQ